ncbi:MAG: hypothetical protein JWR38_602 [Mucilaginibacter sp.]|nr:hypothetical protein [Mucilaginibacter sp.]
MAHFKSTAGLKALFIGLKISSFAKHTERIKNRIRKEPIKD